VKFSIFSNTEVCPSMTSGHHLHLYYSHWELESRAWRAGTSAVEAGFATSVTYVGYAWHDRPPEQELRPRQRIVRLGAPPPPLGEPKWRRALALPRWWINVIRTFGRRRDISIVTSHSLASLPVGVVMSRLCGAGLIYDAHELETERSGWPTSLRKIAKVVERLLIPYCDHTVVVNDTIRDWYVKRYGTFPITTVRNVPIIPDSAGCDSSLRQQLGIPADDLVCVYCGIFTKGRFLTELVEVFGGLSPSQHLVLIGFGPLDEIIRNRALHVGNVHVIAAVPQEQLIPLMSGADIGLFFTNRDAGSSYDYALPNKVFEYAAAKLGILCGTGPELQRFAANYPWARSCEATVDAVQRVLRDIDLADLRRRRHDMHYQPPSWASESGFLLGVYRSVSDRASRRRIWST
jgi:hypothetical protein